MPTRRAITSAVKRYQRLMGFGRQCVFSLAWHDSEKNPIDKKVPGQYAGAECYPQYRRCILRFDPRHGNWADFEFGRVGNAVRHEMAHYPVAPIAAFVERIIRELTADPAARRVLREQFNDLEDELVSFISDMPVWERVDSCG